MTVQIEAISSLAQYGSLGLFFAFYIYIAKVHSENMAKSQEHQGRQFELLIKTTSELTHVFGRYSETMSELTRQIEANTAITRQLAEQLKGK